MIYVRAIQACSRLRETWMSFRSSRHRHTRLLICCAMTVCGLLFSVSLFGQSVSEIIIQRERARSLTVRVYQSAAVVTTTVLWIVGRLIVLGTRVWAHSWAQSAGFSLGLFGNRKENATRRRFS